jgi:peroxiredoxin
VITAIMAFVAAPLAAQTVGDTAPAFTLKTLDGNSVSLSDFKGHPVVINFWASWCVPCRHEMPVMVEAYRAHNDSGLIILAVNSRDQETSTRAVRRFVAEFQMPFPVLLDEHGDVRRRYGLRGLPTSVFIGADGMVRGVIIGPFTPSAFETHLKEILSAP